MESFSVSTIKNNTLTGDMRSPASTPQLIKLYGATFLSVLAEKSALLVVLSFIVLFGPGGEGTGTGSLELLLPAGFLGFATGVFTDRIGGRKAMIAALILRAVTTVSVPALMIATNANRYAVGFLIFVIAWSGTLFSLGRFSLIAATIRPMKLIQANSLLLFVQSIAAVCAVALFRTASIFSLPADTLKVCCFIALGAAALIGATTPPPPQPEGARRRLRGSPMQALAGYIKSHRSARNVLRLTVTLYPLFAFWIMLMLVFAMENYQPGGFDLNALFVFSLSGCAIGALLAPRANRIARPLTVLTGAIVGLSLSSMMCVAANSLTTVKYALGIAGASSGVALVVIDTLLQRVFPSRFRASIAGCRDAIMASILLICALSVEQQFDRMSLVVLFRFLGVFNLAIVALYILMWPRLARFLVRFCLYPLLAMRRSIRTDAPHHLTATRASVFLCNQLAWNDAALVTGTFVAPTKFMYVSSRTRPLDRAFIGLVGGVVVPDDDKAMQLTETLLKRGYNILFLADEFADPKANLLNRMLDLAESSAWQLVPTIIANQPGSTELVLKFGVPCSSRRKVSPQKFVDEIESLRLFGAKRES